MRLVVVIAIAMFLTVTPGNTAQRQSSGVQAKTTAAPGQCRSRNYSTYDQCMTSNITKAGWDSAAASYWCTWKCRPKS